MKIGVGLRRHSSVLVVDATVSVNMLDQGTLRCTSSCLSYLVGDTFLSSDPENTRVWVVRVFVCEPHLLLGVWRRKVVVSDLGV